MKRAIYILGCWLIAFSTAQAQEKPSVSLPAPGMYGPLALNPRPYNFTAGPLGTVYVSGAVSGMGLAQTHHISGDRDGRLDVGNAQLFVQAFDGPVQFFAQAGGYALSSLGAPYVRMDRMTEKTFGPVPVAYVKIAPSGNFSIQAGKLYTLIGTENTFTYQNANIERGLLWNQTNAVNRGVQINYAQGPLSVSAALSDGFYSGNLNWLSGLATYAVDTHNSITLIASGNIRRDGTSTFATPLFTNNSHICDLYYSYGSGPWTLSPTLQYTHVPKAADIGIADSASTWGIGLTAKYIADPHWSIAGRAEYIDTDGGLNLAYGPASNAWSLTVTPTWQQGIFFARAEASYVQAGHITSGAAFGASGNDRSQSRLLLETGILF